MNKFINKIPWAIAIILLICILALNIVYTSELTSHEQIKTTPNGFTITIIPIIIMCSILTLCLILKNNSSKIKNKYFLFGAVIVIYIVGQLLWISNRYIPIAADQKYAYDVAVAMKENNLQEFVESTTSGIYGSNDISMKTYLECYPQQFTLSFVWNLLFHLFNSTNIIIVVEFNAFCNALTVISIFLICKELSKKYNINKYLGTILILTFLPLSLLSIFAYGDIPGLAFSMLSVYFIIKYVNDKKIRYSVLSTLSLSLAYMVRTNSLIFIIAILIYLFLDIISKNETKKTAKDIAIKIAVIIGLVVTIILPTNIIKNYYSNKLGLDKNKSFPINGWLNMAMEESNYGPRMV